MAAAKKGSLFKAPNIDQEPEAVPAAAAEPEQKKGPKRGQHLISGMFDPPAYRQFGVLAAERGMDKRELLQEALNDLFVKYGKPPIA